MQHFRSQHFAAFHFASNQFRGVAVTPTPDTHDGFGFWEKYWANLHKKKKIEPTLEEVIEAVQENPVQALKAVPAVKSKFQSVDYDSIKRNTEMAMFIAREILITIELRRIEEENDENDAIMLLLM